MPLPVRVPEDLEGPGFSSLGEGHASGSWFDDMMHGTVDSQAHVLQTSHVFGAEIWRNGGLGCSQVAPRW